MLMSLTMRSMAARMFCWVSARCVTTMAEVIPVLNRLAMAVIIIKPTAMEIMSSMRLKPASEFCFRIFMFPCLASSGRPKLKR